MINIRDYPYMSDCIWQLIEIRDKTGLEIQELKAEIEIWLEETKSEYVWSDYDTDNPMTMTIDRYGTNYPISRNFGITFPISIYFKKEIDLLAFRLRWGFQ